MRRRLPLFYICADIKAWMKQGFYIGIREPAVFGKPFVWHCLESLAFSADWTSDTHIELAFGDQ